MKLRSVLVALTLGALAAPAQAAPTSQPVDISDQLTTQCQVKRYVPLFRVCSLDDGYGSFVAETMPAKGTVKAYGTDFTWLGNDLNAKDGLLAPNQVIPVPGAVKGFKALALLATAADGDAGVKGTAPASVDS